MNKKVLLLTASLLALTMLVTPVMSESPKKIPVIIDQSGAWYIPPPPTDVWISGNVKHGRGFTGGWTSYNILGGDISLSGSMSCVGKYNVNLKNGHGAVHRNMVLTFPGGTFEGQHNQRGIFAMMPPGVEAFPMVMDGATHAVFHGTDDYLGWTFVVRRATGEPPEAYMLIP